MAPFGHEGFHQAAAATPIDFRHGLGRRAHCGLRLFDSAAHTDARPQLEHSIPGDQRHSPALSLAQPEPAAEWR